ncbi:hypothetical protein N656DRAFT_778695 [Canariomyces notabilis]|uniref:Uncharacterized protein n=1 Tax=Canariomyces notabilis TaxID=2074819 RepID=A0AAN6TFC9_9PEZI|nr:hypothetical protein N656DRAFT_778695 [Canariomyces arenarius]
MHRAVSSFQYAPDTLICLGQLITSPRQPYRRLAPPLLPLPSEPIISPVTTWSFTSSETNGGSASVFAHFLQLFTASVSGHAARELAQSWSAARLETRFLELGPAGDSENDYVRRSVSEVESVCEWLKVNRRLGKTIYMVTGVKVAMQPGEAKSGVSRTA